MVRLRRRDAVRRGGLLLLLRAQEADHRPRRLEHLPPGGRGRPRGAPERGERRGDRDPRSRPRRERPRLRRPQGGCRAADQPGADPVRARARRLQGAGGGRRPRRDAAHAHWEDGPDLAEADGGSEPHEELTPVRKAAIRSWTSSLVGSVHTARWPPFSIRMTSAFGMRPAAFSVCSIRTSESAVPWTSSVGTRIFSSSRSSIVGNCSRSFARPAFRPEIVPEIASTNSRFSSSFQMCSVSSWACSFVRSASSVAASLTTCLGACRAISFRTHAPSPPVSRLYSRLLIPLANSYFMLTPASTTRAVTRSGCFIASRYDDGPPPDQHITANRSRPSESISASSKSDCWSGELNASVSGVSRYPGRDSAITRNPRRTRKAPITAP